MHLKKKALAFRNLSAVCGRGGLLRPIEGGTYSVNDAMIEDLKKGYSGQHARILVALLANEIAYRLKHSRFHRRSSRRR